MDGFIGLQRIKENKNQSEVREVCQALIKIIDDIITHPNDESKRRIKLDSYEVSTHLMPYSGGMETLFEIGFEEDNDSLTLPATVKPEAVQKLRNELDSITNSDSMNVSSIQVDLPSIEPSTPVAQNLTKSTIQAPRKDMTVTPATTSAASRLTVPGNELEFETTPLTQQCMTTLIAQHQAAPAGNRTKKRTFAVKSKNDRFANRLQSSYDHVLLYEQAFLKEKARSCMSIEKFQSEALAKFTAYKSSTKDEKPYGMRDFLLLELMAWFKNDFFKWVNQPNCDHCARNQNMVFKYPSPASNDESIWMAGNVEVYECSSCRKLTRFPRYNHPEKLLETRQGRCGEWANCFTLLLRSLDFDARYILDWTDHVWSEVFSESQQRWMHVDPCENILDKPLIYEHGWGKSLKYIIAFSSYQCIDVTWRYTTKFKEVMSRRDECSENWLVRYTNKVSAKRQVHFDDARVRQVQMRTATEIVEFLTPKVAKDGEEVGRQSGSLQWRLNRGEIRVPEKEAGFAFKISPSSEGCFRVQYNSVKDTYVSVGQNTSEIKGWDNCAHKYQSIRYMIENDWKMVYLARTDGSDSAYIEWLFDLKEVSEKKQLIKNIQLKLQSDCFVKEAEIKWSVFWSDSATSFADTDKVELSDIQITSLPFKMVKEATNEWRLSDVTRQDLTVFKIRADLTGGWWQQTQLFRQKLSDNQNLFDVCFYFD